MTAFSPTNAALEGLRVMRREPQAVFYWIAVWTVALVLVGVVVFGLNAAGLQSLASIRKFGPLGVVVLICLDGLRLLNLAAIYRAVLSPGEHSWHLFKLGPDEARIAVLSGCLSVLAFGASVLLYFFLTGPANVMFFVSSAVSPGAIQFTAMAGALGTVALIVWVGVRLSLATVQTFDRKSFPIDSYWGLARGAFWHLLGSYLVLWVLIFAFVGLFGVVGLVIGGAGDVALQWKHPNLLQRILQLALVPATAALLAAWNVVFWTMFAACQAYAYQAITRARAPSPSPAA